MLDTVRLSRPPQPGGELPAPAASIRPAAWHHGLPPGPGRATLRTPPELQTPARRRTADIVPAAAGPADFGSTPDAADVRAGRSAWSRTSDDPAVAEWSTDRPPLRAAPWHDCDAACAELRASGSPLPTPLACTTSAPSSPTAHRPPPRRGTANARAVPPSSTRAAPTATVEIAAPTAPSLPCRTPRAATSAHCRCRAPPGASLLPDEDPLRKSSLTARAASRVEHILATSAPLPDPAPP